MGDRRITVFEPHFEGDVQIGPSTVPGFDGGDETTSTDERAPEDGGPEEEGGSRVTSLLAALVVIAVVIVLWKYLNGGDEVDE